LKIPGLNAPIPEGTRYGYHPGGWGKPPVDEFGRPLYGDVFGTAPPEPPPEITQPIERNHWGEFVEEEQEEEEASEGEQEEEEEVNKSGLETPSGIETPSGMQTPESLELRKGSKKDTEPPLPPTPSSSSHHVSDEDNSNKQLYQVLEKSDLAVGSSLYGSSHKYTVPEKKELKNKNVVPLIHSQKTEKMDISLNPSEVENLEHITTDVLKQKYEQALSEKQTPREDVSDLMAEHSKKKRKKESKGQESKKKYKDFKF